MKKLPITTLATLAITFGLVGNDTQQPAQTQPQTLELVQDSTQAGRSVWGGGEEKPPKPVAQVIELIQAGRSAWSGNEAKPPQPTALVEGFVLAGPIYGDGNDLGLEDPRRKS